MYFMYSSSPYLWGLLQDPQWMPNTTGSVELYVSCFFPVQIHLWQTLIYTLASVRLTIVLLCSHVNGGRRLLLSWTQTAAARLGKVFLPPLSAPLVLAMSMVPPNRSRTSWPWGINQVGNQYIQQSKPLTLERKINLYPLTNYPFRMRAPLREGERCCSLVSTQEGGIWEDWNEEDYGRGSHCPWAPATSSATAAAGDDFLQTTWWWT